jgi:hypothetical protein
MRNVKLMADYECFAIWDEDLIDNINPDDLPISDELKSRIHQWEDAFDITLNRQDPANSGFSSIEALQRFDDEGKDIWYRLRNELGDQYVVRYFSPKSRKVVEP